jgi:hypothetical protein
MLARPALRNQRRLERFLPRQAALVLPPGVLPVVTPLFATLTESWQLTENTATLSPAFATLTPNSCSKSFVCHSYMKSPGVGGTESVWQLAALVVFSWFHGLFV